MRAPPPRSSRHVRMAAQPARPLPLRWVYLHMRRELAQHCGHADILRESS